MDWLSNPAFKMILICFLAVTAFSRMVTSQPSDGSIICRIRIIKVMMMSHMEETLFYCERPSDKLNFKLELPKTFMDQHHRIEIGKTIISIPGGQFVEDINGRPSYIDYPAGAEITVIGRSSNRRLVSDTAGPTLKTMGVRKILAVRVTTLDWQPKPSPRVIGAQTYGLGLFRNQSVNILTQTKACSFGKLTYVPTIPDGSINGVLDVKVAVDFRIAGLETYFVDIVAAVQAIYGPDLSKRFDNVMFCVPSSVRWNGQTFAASAIFDHYASFYTDNYCGAHSFLMHELGHNLGLGHSSDASWEYGDQSCLMGVSYLDLGGPSMCFNGQKNWWLKWYADRQVEVDDRAPWTGKLAAFTDYDETTQGEHVVIVKIGNHYLQYNKAEKFNAGVKQSGNLITISSSLPNLRMSNATGTLGFNDTKAPSIFYFGNFLDTNFTMVVEVCDRVMGKPDYMVLSVHLEDGFQSSYCRGGVQRSRAPSSSKEPSVEPSSAPSRIPTPAPTTRPPSPAPTKTPTREPTAHPTKMPTKMPITSLPTKMPTMRAPSVCEDSKVGKFWVDSGRWAMWRDCLWLSKSAMWHSKLCYEPLNHAARVVCPELCDACEDDCKDDKTFSTLVQGLQVGCDWLSVRRGMTQHLCKRADFAMACKETCDKCAAI